MFQTFYMSIWDRFCLSLQLSFGFLRLSFCLLRLSFYLLRLSFCLLRLSFCLLWLSFCFSLSVPFDCFSIFSYLAVHFLFDSFYERKPVFVWEGGGRWWPLFPFSFPFVFQFSSVEIWIGLCKWSRFSIFIVGMKFIIVEKILSLS